MSNLPYDDPKYITLSTDADLSSSPYRAVKLSSGTLVVATDASAPFMLLGPNVEDGSSSTAYVGVQNNEYQIGVAGGTVTENAAVTATTGGKLIVTTTDTDHIIGFAMEAAVANDEFIVRRAPGTLSI